MQASDALGDKRVRYPRWGWQTINKAPSSWGRLGVAESAEGSEGDENVVRLRCV